MAIGDGNNMNVGGNQNGGQNGNQNANTGVEIVGKPVTEPNPQGTVEGTTPAGTEDNSSQPNALDAIFNAAQETTPAPEGTTLPPDSETANPMKGIQDMMAGFKTRGEFNAEMLAESADGDLTGMNKLLQDNHQGAVEDSTRITMEMFSKVIPELLGNVKKMIEEAQHTEKGSSALETALPDLMTAEMKPVTQMFYDKAMTVTKGDFTKAIEMTRNAVGLFSSKTANLRDDGEVPQNEGRVEPNQDFSQWFSR